MYFKISKCRSCGNRDLINIVNLENNLWHSLLKNLQKIKKEAKVTLALCMCRKCN